MKKKDLKFVWICILVACVLILAAFVDTDRIALPGASREIGGYAAYVPAAREAAEKQEEASETPGGTLAALSALNDFVNSRIAWGLFMCALLIASGLVLTVRTRAVQFRHFGAAMKNTVGRIFSKGRDTGTEGGITPFQALCSALAGTVGTGNIAGVTGAIVLGGPGAVFWMWMAALAGMCTKYAEIVLSMKYRVRGKNGEWLGGPMYTIVNGMGRNWKWLAVLFCALGCLASFGIGSMAQTNTIAQTMSSAASTLFPGMTQKGTDLMRLIVGLFLAALTALVLFGGVKRLGKVTEKIVPVMSGFYIVGSLIVILAHADRLGPALGSIFSAAFTGEAVIGGVGGFVIMNTIKRGVGRGVFTNEAGMGSAPIVHAASSETDPVRQGFYGILEVFMDTFLICTMTALVVLTGNVVPWGDASLAGAQTTTASFATVFGSGLSSVFIAVSILFFAFSTILSWSYYGRRCFSFLTGGRFVPVYQALFLMTVVAGATMSLDLVWNLSDTFNGLMTVPNLISLLSLSGVVAAETRRYFRKREK